MMWWMLFRLFGLEVRVEVGLKCRLFCFRCGLFVLMYGGLEVIRLKCILFSGVS